ncbi:hypothetical protein COOONC_27698 [Cooperia oncophora]
MRVLESTCGEPRLVPAITETSDVLSNHDFREKLDEQGKVFAAKCKERGWKVEEVSRIDSFMDRLHSHVNEMNERLAQIELFSWRHSIDTPKFLRTVFGSRPFFDVNRNRTSVDECLNTFFTYPQKTKETIPRKAFNSYVENLREKIRAKQKVPSLTRMQSTSMSASTRQ